MTPEEILQGLRDIHLPAETSDAAGAGLVVWPLVLVAVLILLGAWLAWRRRGAWRRDFARHLDGIESHASAASALEGWAELAVLLKRAALQVTGRNDVARLAGDDWLQTLDRLFGTDLFSAGPGRGIVTFPYRRTGADADDLGEIERQLRDTITALRQRLPHLGRSA